MKFKLFRSLVNDDCISNHVFFQVIETTETKKNKIEMLNATVIVENGAGLVNYGSWRKRKRSSRWSLRGKIYDYRFHFSIDLNSLKCWSVFHFQKLRDITEPSACSALTSR